MGLQVLRAGHLQTPPLEGEDLGGRGHVLMRGVACARLVFSRCNNGQSLFAAACREFGVGCGGRLVAIAMLAGFRW